MTLNIGIFVRYVHFQHSSIQEISHKKTTCESFIIIIGACVFEREQRKTVTCFVMVNKTLHNHFSLRCFSKMQALQTI